MDIATLIQVFDTRAGVVIGGLIVPARLVRLEVLQAIITGEDTSHG